MKAWHGPWDGEDAFWRFRPAGQDGPGGLDGPAEPRGPAGLDGLVGRVAVLSDVHANVPALEAVLDEPDVRAADLVVFCGDLTWGSEPAATIDTVRALGERAVFIRGNAERALIDPGSMTRPREKWMLAQHPPEAVRFLRGFHFNAVVDVAGLGAVRFCHGSPRSDHELITPRTPDERMTALSAGIDERTLVSGHTHLQFDRLVGTLRSVNPGSVGLPYHRGPAGTAYWALLGPDVHLRQTRYDVTESIRRGTAAGDPLADRIAEMLTGPPTPEEITEDADHLEFSD